MSAPIVSIGMGIARASRDVTAELVAFSLGSCVALCAWDAVGPVAAMAHIVLPCSPDPRLASAKYADHAVPLLIKLLQRMGGCPGRAQWKMAGGAHVLKGAGLPQIGERNVLALRQAMQLNGLAVVAEDTGGSAGRTVRLRVRDGVLALRFAGGGERFL